jgi:hypothetical protein
MNYKDFYIGRLLNSISQVGNAAINGNPDVSISGRIGEYNFFYKDSKTYKFAQWIVDTTFFPIDGKDHCLKAYLNDRGEDYTVGKGWVYGEWLMILISVAFCIPLSVLFWIYYGIKKLFTK